MVKAQTLKGFRDFLPEEAKKRQYVMSTLRGVFETFGFNPLETPALEYEEILLGKYGEEGDKLMYRFTDNGDRKVALRYDQTVPFSRVVAQYANTLPMPFKRYQMQNVWRAENTQKGRFREFLQCDADIVGSSSPLADAEVLAVAAKAIKSLGFKNFKILINDRSTFAGLPVAAIIAVDKLKKIGPEGVVNELLGKGIAKNSEEASQILKDIEEKQPTDRLQEIFSLIETMGVTPQQYEYSPTLARGLDYYTGLIFEIEIDGYTVGSVCGGGRYDKLIGMFAGKDIPAVGFAFGFDRLMEALSEQNLFPSDLQTTKVLVTIFSPELQDISVQATSSLRAKNINTELYLEKDAKMEKQLKYANQKGIPYVVIIGPEEAEKNVVKMKDMNTGEQKTMTVEEALSKLSS
ncbi:MAG: histidine--tRNA ligase [Candidatus Levybacteria bacterium]|nr:histidine--tRNA ligase [Candidatus Levybacteria bacterium]